MTGVQTCALPIYWTISWWHDNNVFDRTKDTFETALASIQRVQSKYSNVGLAGEISKHLEKYSQNTIAFSK